MKQDSVSNMEFLMQLYTETLFRLKDINMHTVSSFTIKNENAKLGPFFSIFAYKEVLDENEEPKLKTFANVYAYSFMDPEENIKIVNEFIDEISN